MLRDHATYAPLVLEQDIEGTEPSYTLSLTDADMEIHTELFEAKDRIPNGYAWADLALQAMRTHAPDLEDRLDMDPEAGTFVAYGSDLEGLQQLGRLLHAAFHDTESLGRLLAGAPWEYD